MPALSPVLITISTFEIDNMNIRHVGGKVSQWSSLVCHLIVDDDVQSAWQIISNLGWAPTRKTVTVKENVHTHARGAV